MKSLIIVPTYNEKGNVERLVGALFDLDRDIEILIVDDNSPDGTGEIADRLSAGDRRVHVLHRPGKLGLGSAYIQGFNFALNHGYDLIFEMDADFSHDPSYIPRFLEKIQDCDVVLGSRYIQGVNVINWPMSRLLLSYFANLYTRIVTGLPVKDATGGFKCFRRETLEAVDLDQVKSDGYSFQIEMTFKCWKKGFRVCEIPIIFYERQKGRSKMSKKIVHEAVWMVWRLRLLSLLRRI
ncbi:MAG: dolichyl-phosphate beta-D-mannosyltransferase [candidate division Zixibacteria bacterium SM23_81]|nr:MAG: dolichyl-phosphate beta-D-mannosyltransferase [candidate division Zixibacteria bacterium SM23_81]